MLVAVASAACLAFCIALASRRYAASRKLNFVPLSCPVPCCPPSLALVHPWRGPCALSAACPACRPHRHRELDQPRFTRLLCTLRSLPCRHCWCFLRSITRWYGVRGDVELSSRSAQVVEVPKKMLAEIRSELSSDASNMAALQVRAALSCCPLPSGLLPAVLKAAAE